ncbi:MAG: amidohydrolase [Chloroflexota bacterium]
MTGLRGAPPGADLRLRDFAPRSMLRVPEHLVEQPRFPVVDAHNHVGSVFGGKWLERPVGELLAILDRAGVATLVDLDGAWGDQLRAEIARYQEPYPDRFVVFAGIDYRNFEVDRAFGETEARRLRDSASAGARGLKVWKALGLWLRDPNGRLITPDDPRLDPLWETAGELRLPVLIHVADPIAFFEPLDGKNERYEELLLHPDWHFYPTRPPDQPDRPGFPTFDEVIEQLARLVERHPETTFIGAHVGCNAEDLRWVGQLLDACPNFYVDIGARLAELGRQPYTAREFFLRYSDRILFGVDQSPDVEIYRRYYRFLETRDEYFSYDVNDPPGQGRWAIYGIDLPDEVLRRVYGENARRLLGLPG